MSEPIKKLITVSMVSGEPFSFELECYGVRVDLFEQYISDGLMYCEDGFIHDIRTTLNALPEEKLIIRIEGKPERFYFQSKFIHCQITETLTRGQLEDVRLQVLLMHRLFSVIERTHNEDKESNMIGRRRTVAYTTPNGDAFQFDIESSNIDLDKLETWIRTGIDDNNDGFKRELCTTLDEMKEEKFVIHADQQKDKIVFSASFAGKQRTDWVNLESVNNRNVLSTLISVLFSIASSIDTRRVLSINPNNSLGHISDDAIGLYIELYEQMIRQENRILSEIKGGLNEIKLKRNILLNKEAEQLKVIENLERKRSALLERIGK